MRTWRLTCHTHHIVAGLVESGARLVTALLFSRSSPTFIYLPWLRDTQVQSKRTVHEVIQSVSSGRRTLRARSGRTVLIQIRTIERRLDKCLL